MNNHKHESGNTSLLRGVVQDLSHDGRGVLKVEGRVYFVPGALTGENITFSPRKRRRGQFSGELVSIEQSSPDRVSPKCEYFGVCGGCTLQHLSPDAQLASKESTLLDTLLKIGRVEPDKVEPRITGSVWGYRRKARPGSKLVAKKGGVLVGFREQGSSYLTSLKHCDTLDPRLSALLEPLHRLIESLSIPAKIPQIEMAAATNGVSLVIRHLDALIESDKQKLQIFAEEWSVNLYLQPGGLNSIVPLWPIEPDPLFYVLPHFDLELQFEATDFVQVNERVNEKMIIHALDALELTPDSKLLDLFCGLGNFTLPAATQCNDAIGVEADQALLDKAKMNIQRNCGKHRFNGVQFQKMDLHNDQVTALAEYAADRILLDPPRSGALDVVTHLVPLLMPEVIVYVSCNPATLARDAEILVHRHGYQLQSATAINMFPHTGHVESMAKFVKRDG
ncbi:MAG: 23S rRNA (uracil(1939)-C(5))-methyltransferase RlmD [Acidiferrobacterales bacterium]|nr:23S rRNA (uracil(1939)-C(5))-methyltransferase RlmD [Acidiferrobacterales bacterium]